MKTAMQELMELNDFLKIMGVTIEWEKYLEKEKEQSIELIKQTAMFMAAAPLDEEIAKMSYEDVYNSYYNQTYNQKIPELLYKDGTPMRKVKLGKEAQELLDEATKRFNQPNL